MTHHTSASGRPLAPPRRSRLAWHPLLALLAAVGVAVSAVPAQASTSDPLPSTTIAAPTGASATPSPEPTASATPATPSPTPEVSTAPSPSPSPEVSDVPSPVMAPDQAPVVEVLASESSVFSDVSGTAGSATYSAFADDIEWMAARGISTGYPMPDGTTQYRPQLPVARDAMAAFLHRFQGAPALPTPTTAVFTDVPVTHPFAREITWTSTTGVSQGWPTAGGLEYRPSESITRDAMAAFLYRLWGSPAFTFPATSPFTDVSSTSPFAKEIAWLESVRVTTGWDTGHGREYRPYEPITREAMAAYLRRLDAVPSIELGGQATTLRHSTLYVYGAATLNLRSGPSTAYPVVTTRSNGDALAATGVTDGAWIQLRVDNQDVWARGDYLIGRNGETTARLASRYSNGRIPGYELCGFSWDAVESLACTAAHDLELMNAAFRAQFGMNIPLNDTYRDYDTQVLFVTLYGDLAAVPGTSNHGWGAAVDIGTSRLPNGTNGAQYAWLVQHAAVYNWVLPTWARPDGAKPEAWHFEFTG